MCRQSRLREYFINNNFIMPKTTKGQKPTSKSYKRLKPIAIISGLHDTLPNEMLVLQHITQTAEEVCRSFNLKKIATPIIEQTDLYARGINNGSTLLEKELVSFIAADGNELTLRPECTMGVIRAFIEQEMAKLPHPVKIYYDGAIFNYNDKQLKTITEDQQFGVEFLGESKTLIDAQVIYLAWKILQRLKLTNIHLFINSVGCSVCKAKYKKCLADYFDIKVNKLCADCKVNAFKNPISVLGCREDKCIQVSTGAPQIIDNLCMECHSHFKNVLEFLDELEIPYSLNANLIGEVGYYNKTVFEFRTITEDEKSVVLCQGGRYDNLVKSMGGEEISGVGFALYMPEIAEQIINLKLEHFEPSPYKQVFLIQLGDTARKKILKIMDKLLDGGITVGESLSNNGMKIQLRLAAKAKSKLALIVGHKEALDDTVIIRDMESGIQETVMMKDVLKEVKRMLK